MKKFLALVMAMMMVLAMGTAFADEVWDGKYASSDPVSFSEIEKTYTSENSKIVTETLTFTSEGLTTNPDAGAAELTIAPMNVTSLTPGKLNVTIPSLSEVGVYEWIVTENQGNTAGVTYSDAEVHVIALVEYNNDTHKLQVASTTSYIKLINGEKAKTYNNTFKSGSFSVAKEVTGNMANQNDKFEITVTLTLPQGKVIGTPITVGGETVAADQWVNGVYTKTLTLSHADGATTFSNIPVGVVVTVEENKNEEKMNGYTYVSTTVGEDAFTSLTIVDETASDIVVTNEKTDSVQTGFDMDSAPYMMIMAMVVLAGVAMMMKRRAYND